MSAYSEFACSIARTADLVGEPWTVLVLRDLFAGLAHFDEIQRDLGIASNILAARLKRLQAAGIVEREADPGDARRRRYRLTGKGRDLYPVLVAMMGWGDKWLAAPGEQPLLMVHQRCGHVTAAVPSCSVCREPLPMDELRFLPGPGARPGLGTSGMGHALMATRGYKPAGD